MIVFCYLVWQHLHLAWYSLILDWTIFNPEPALSPVVLTIQRRQSPKSVSISRKESTVSNLKGIVPKLFTSKNEILDAYSDVFDGIGCFPGPPYYIQVNPSVTPKQTPHQPIPVHLKESFKEEVDKMLQVGVLKPVLQATPWINSFALVEGKHKLGNLKFRICLWADQSE